MAHTPFQPSAKDRLAAANLDTTVPPLNQTPMVPFDPSGKLVLAAGKAPVDGYVLEERLGRGGFGEVWRALGPGGFRVAMKFIPLEDRAGRVEKRSLELMRQIQHPHLLALFGAWERHDTLIIAMELASGTLQQRLEAAVQQGWFGIPPTELLEYMREAAKGIDYLNEPLHKLNDGPPQGIQHRDIKPQNLLLLGSGVKVADFGLVKLLEQSVMEVSGSMTPAYAAPEQFNGQATRWSDQYSLAVTYCQLRGNQLPFTGNAAHIVAGHVSKPPTLTMLPEPERPVVARALAKEPTQRWPTCKAFVEALAEAITGTVRKNPSSPEVRVPPKPDEEYHRFVCPTCGTALRVKTVNLSKRIRCSACKSVVPTDPSGPVPVAQPHGPLPARVPVAPDQLPVPPDAQPRRRGLLARLYWGLLAFLFGTLVLAASATVTLMLLWAVFCWWQYGAWPGTKVSAP